MTVPVLKVIPGFDTPYMTLPLLLIPLMISWWSVVSGGMEPGGGGQVAQRMLAARDERHAAGASLWFNVAHFAVRVWPWLLVGLACVLIYPDTTNFQSVYASAIRDVLPAGLRGLVVASFFAAFISTMDTRLNLGSAYLVNDFYRRFWVRKREEQHYVRAGRVTTLLLCLVPFSVPYFFKTDILNVLMFWLQITAGTGLVYMLRWYWWRVNAWSEISAMASAVLYTLLLLVFKYDGDLGAYVSQPDSGLVDILIVTVLTTFTWIGVTFMTPPDSRAGLEAFYLRTRPAGRGWARVRAGLSDPALAFSPDDLRACFVGWISAAVFLFAVFYGVGKLLLQEPGVGLALLAVSVLAFVAMLRTLRAVFH